MNQVEHLKKFRKKMKLSVKDLAKILNCSHRPIENWEQGRYPINKFCLKILESTKTWNSIKERKESDE